MAIYQPPGHAFSRTINAFRGAGTLCTARATRKGFDRIGLPRQRTRPRPDQRACCARLHRDSPRVDGRPRHRVRRCRRLGASPGTFEERDDRCVPARTRHPRRGERDGTWLPVARHRFLRNERERRHRERACRPRRRPSFDPDHRAGSTRKQWGTGTGLRRECHRRGRRETRRPQSRPRRGLPSAERKLRRRRRRSARLPRRRRRPLSHLTVPEGTPNRSSRCHREEIHRSRRMLEAENMTARLNRLACALGSDRPCGWRGRVRANSAALAPLMMS